MTRGTVSSQDLYTITDPNTAGYSEHILPTYIIKAIVNTY